MSFWFFLIGINYPGGQETLSCLLFFHSKKDSQKLLWNLNLRREVSVSCIKLTQLSKEKYGLILTTLSWLWWTFLQVICWVLGEYGTTSGLSASEVLDRLSAISETQSVSDLVRGHILSAFSKIIAQNGVNLTSASEELQEAALNSSNPDIQQRALELEALIRYTLTPVLKVLLNPQNLLPNFTSVMNLSWKACQFEKTLAPVQNKNTIIKSVVMTRIEINADLSPLSLSESDSPHVMF